MYSQLSQKSQMRVFNPTPHNTRKIVVATNIAETSITIDGIVYVVDSGFVKTPFYNPLVGMDALLVQPTSQAEAIQRAGRAGRVRAGKCFRLYTEETYKSLKETSTPEMQRSNLEWTVLQLKALGIEDIAHFDFPSPPPAESIIRALELLFAIGCINDECKLTQPLGQLLAEFPVSPRLGKALYTSLELGCTEDILTITSMLSVQNPFVKHGNSKEAKEKLEEAIASFAHSTGDHLTHLKVYNEWLEAGQKDAWCKENSLDIRALKRAKEVRAQLRGYMKRLKPSSLDISTCNGDSDLIRKCMVSGFFGNAARLSSNGLYKTVKDNRVVSLHPSSVLYRSTKALPNWIIFHDVTLTSQEFIRDVSAINPRWLFDLAPHFYEMKNEEALNTNEGPTLKKSKVEKAPAAPGSLSSHPSIGKGSGGRLEAILQRYR
jgi:ATP-dependent RNA helicase DDX35